MVEGLVSVVIPRRSPRDDLVRDAEMSISAGDYSSKEFIFIPDIEGRGANWARNQGWRQAKGEYLLFSDCDCTWKPEALSVLMRALQRDPKASYAYCAFRWGSGQRALGPFSSVQVRRGSCFSTMSLFRAKDFPGFDESIRRLQDWDLYLTLLKRDGRLGVCVPLELFTTPEREGMSHGTEYVLSHREAVEIVAKKHGMKIE